MGGIMEAMDVKISCADDENAGVFNGLQRPPDGGPADYEGRNE